MKPSIEKLQKFFKLEANRDYDNKAVMGGLAKMLDSWEVEARNDQCSEALIQVVHNRLQDYHRLSPESRREALRGLWNRVRREEQGIAEDIIPAESIDDSASQEAPMAETSVAAPEEAPAEQTEAQPSEADPEPPAETPPAEPMKAAPRPKQPKPDGPPAALQAPTTVLDGVGPKNAEKLEKLGIRTLRDMLYHYPRRYDDYSQLKTINRLKFGDELTVLGTVQSVSTRRLHGGKSSLTEVIINDSTASLRLTWFNQPWLDKSIKEGDQIVAAGKIDQYLGRLVMNSPEWEPLEAKNLHTNRILPVYPLTAKITQRWLRTQMDKVVNYWAPRVADPMPEMIIKDAELLELGDALQQTHFPDSWDDLRAAQHRLAFDEIFYLQIGVLQQKRLWAERTAHPFTVEADWLEAQTTNLPFTLTGAQQKTLMDILQDLASGQPMNRLVQGDVGSGKTVVAALAAAVVVNGGAQVAILAPTSILAEQHYISFTNFLAGEGGMLQPEQVQLMLGATPEKIKEEIRTGLADGNIKVIVGTHALLEDPILFQNLKLAIIDEQHRFGVKQRATLRNKGENPHLLVMTATPIPRSLALTIYGDLDLSVMDEMPPGREPVDTYVIYPRERERIYNLIRREVKEGRQAFVIYPLVEESEKLDSKAAVEEHQRLQKEVFRNLKLGLLHGRLKGDEKDAVMTQFRDKEFDVLVSTTVVEVGVDIPNATVMLIEGANRFGLAQLHQLRGRVGRGGGKSYCILIPESENGVDNERLAVMAETNDGFVLAEKDLEQRGPGQFLGSRQAGFSELDMASLSDVRLIEKARKHAHALLESDPDLNNDEHAPLREALDQRWQEGEGDIS